MEKIKQLVPSTHGNSLKDRAKEWQGCDAIKKGTELNIEEQAEKLFFAEVESPHTSSINHALDSNRIEFPLIVRVKLSQGYNAFKTTIGNDSSVDSCETIVKDGISAEVEVSHKKGDRII